MEFLTDPAWVEQAGNYLIFFGIVSFMGGIFYMLSSSFLVAVMEIDIFCEDSSPRRNEENKHNPGISRGK